MDQVYRDAARGGLTGSARPVISGVPGVGREALDGWTREQANEIFNLFPEGPNPVLLMYVFPHLTGDGTPVPGFTTGVSHVRATLLRAAGRGRARVSRERANQG